MFPPVITIDGPGGSGKGTVSQLLALQLKWHYLDSGALYRALAWVCVHDGIDLTDEIAITKEALNLPVRYVELGEAHRLIYQDYDITDEIRTEAISQKSSIISAFPKVREALLARQRAFRMAPGLVTDGRDMGTVIFPDATLKVFLIASAKERAMRRYQQLQKMGINASIDNILAEIEQRDERDRTRAVAKLAPAADAITLDSTGLTIEEVMAKLTQLTLEKNIR